MNKKELNSGPIKRLLLKDDQRKSNTQKETNTAVVCSGTLKTHCFVWLFGLSVIYGFHMVCVLGLHHILVIKQLNTDSCVCLRMTGYMSYKAQMLSVLCFFKKLTFQSDGKVKLYP